MLQDQSFVLYQLELVDVPHQRGRSRILDGSIVERLRVSCPQLVASSLEFSVVLRFELLLASFPLVDHGIKSLLVHRLS